jgi:hypothetical protein
VIDACRCDSIGEVGRLGLGGLMVFKRADDVTGPRLIACLTASQMMRVNEKLHGELQGRSRKPPR